MYHLRPKIIVVTYLTIYRLKLSTTCSLFTHNCCLDVWNRKYCLNYHIKIFDVMTQVLWPSSPKLYADRFWPDGVWHSPILCWCLFNTIPICILGLLTVLKETQNVVSINGVKSSLTSKEWTFTAFELAKFVRHARYLMHTKFCHYNSRSWF